MAKGHAGAKAKIADTPSGVRPSSGSRGRAHPNQERFQALSKDSSLQLTPATNPWLVAASLSARSPTHFRHPLFDLFEGQVFDMGRNRPNMPETIGKSAGTVTVELVFSLLEDLGACSNCAVGHLVNILHIQHNEGTGTS